MAGENVPMSTPDSVSAVSVASSDGAACRVTVTV